MTDMSEAATARREEAPVADSAAAKAKILLVDDEQKSLYALEQLLAPLGDELLTAQSGEEALRLALKHDFAVILLDVRMPGIDGFETAQMIRGRERSRLTPIIFLTAAADEMTSMFRGYEVGAVDFLMKPVVPEVLTSKVAVFVELHRKSQRLRESEEKLRRLAAHLVTIREEERAHIAREVFEFSVLLDLAWLARAPDSIGLRLGISAVIEDKERVLSYWALEHPSEKPDFHHPGGLVVELD
jgi:CheY-like chemotaxis protein